ncbi:MAG: sporulation protein YqfC [Thermaerobacter sp.]
MPARRPAWRKQLAEFLDLPRDVVLDLPRVSIIGGLQVLVQNHRGLVEYLPERVVVAVKGGRLTVRGEDLVIAGVDAEELMVTGRVAAVEFRR